MKKRPIQSLQIINTIITYPKAWFLTLLVMFTNMIFFPDCYHGSVIKNDYLIVTNGIILFLFLLLLVQIIIGLVRFFRKFTDPSQTILMTIMLLFLSVAYLFLLEFLVEKSMIHSFFQQFFIGQSRCRFPL